MNDLRRKQQSIGEILWGLLVGLFFVNFAAVTTMATSFGGKGVLERGGRFILVQGRSVADVDQVIGGLYFFLQRSLLVFSFLAGVLTVVMLLRYGTLRFEIVFGPSDSTKLTLATFARVCRWALWLPLISLVVRLLSSISSTP